MVQRLAANSPSKKDFPASPAKKEIECPVCEDRGVVLREGLAYRCKCMGQKALTRRFKSAKLDGLLRQQTFAGFKLDYYSPSVVDSEYTGRTYREIAEKTLAAAKSFVSELQVNPHARGLLLIGPVGSGKTFLASAIANQLLKHGHQVLFIVVPDLLDALRATYDREKESSSEQELLDSARNVHVLILDDLGAHNYTPWTINKLYSIINHRVNMQLPTVVTTNLELDQLEDCLGERTSSRLVQLCQVYRLLVQRNIRYLVN